MNTFSYDFVMIKRLALKDWHIYQKQLAAYVLGLLVGLTLVGIGKSWSFYLGALVLMVLLICAGGFAIQSSLLNERKEQTLAFVMSLPVSPMDFYWSKLVANFVIYLVPSTLVVVGSLFLVLFTALPDGILVWALLIFTYLAMIFCVSLCVALVVESEGWNIFVQIGLSTTLSPFIMGIGQIDAIGLNIKTNNIVWSWPALGIFLGLFMIALLAVGVSSWAQSRKNSFL